MAPQLFGEAKNQFRVKRFAVTRQALSISYPF
jgi:hypothetical protein